MATSGFTDKYGDWLDETPDGPRARWLDATLGELKPAPMLRVAPQLSVAEVIQLMNERDEGAVLVLEGDVLLGLFTERDVLQRVVGHPESLALPISAVMTVHPHALTESTTLACALRDLALGQHRYLPVIDAVGRPSALLSAKSVVGFLIATFRDEILQGGLERDRACARASGEWRSPFEEELED